MICLNSIVKSPFLAALVAGVAVLLYSISMHYNPKIAPVLVYSLIAFYVVYTVMGGKLLCDEAPVAPAPPTEPAPPAAPQSGGWRMA